MNRLNGIAALVGILGVTAPNILAQESNLPIRFGKEREYTYTRQDTSHDYYSRGLPTSTSKNEGNIHLSPFGFEIWGVLDGARFYYNRSIVDIFEIEKNGIRIKYIDGKPKSYDGDSITVNGHVLYGGESDLFESKQIPFSDQNGQRLITILKSYKNILNIPVVEKQAEAIRPQPSQQEIREALDAFAK